MLQELTYEPTMFLPPLFEIIAGLTYAKALNARQDS